MIDIQLPRLLDCLPIPACVIDPEFRIAYRHPAFEFSPDRATEAGILGKPFPECVQESERPFWRSLTESALTARDSEERRPFVSAELARDWPGHSHRWRATASVVEDVEGKYHGILYTCRELMAPSVDQAKREHDAARLDVARQLAVTLNHEINNPLFVVSATLEDVLAETHDPEMQRRLNNALDAVWRVSDAVKQLSEIRQLVSTVYIEGYPMIDLEASQELPQPEAVGR